MSFGTCEKCGSAFSVAEFNSGPIFLSSGNEPSLCFKCIAARIEQLQKACKELEGLAYNEELSISELRDSVQRVAKAALGEEKDGGQRSSEGYEPATTGPWC